MNIVLISSKTYPSQGGVEYIVDVLAKGLTKKKYNVSVFTNFLRSTSSGFNKWGDYVSWFAKNPGNRIKAFLGLGDYSRGYRSYETYFIAPGISLVRTLLSLILFPITFLHYMYFLAITRPDVINIHFADNAVLYVLLTKILFPRVKVVVSIHGGDVTSFSRNSFHKFLLKDLIRKAEKVVSVSKSLGDQAKKILDFEFDFSIIPNCVDDLFIESPVSSKPENLPDRYVLAVGRLVKKKGFHILIEAFRSFQQKVGGNIHLVIIGDGYNSDALKKQASGQWVHFLGAREKRYILGAIDHCEFFILPSLEESFGIVNLEAMARGKAIISSRVGGVPEYVKDGENGLLVEPSDESHLLDSMIRLYNDERLRKKIGVKAKKDVQKKFTQDALIHNYTNLYRSL